MRLRGPSADSEEGKEEVAPISYYRQEVIGVVGITGRRNIGIARKRCRDRMMKSELKLLIDRERIIEEILQSRPGGDDREGVPFRQSPSGSA